jgi:hypothetical protein
MLMRESLRTCGIAADAPGAAAVIANAARVVPVSAVAMVNRAAVVSELSMSILLRSFRGGSAASVRSGMRVVGGWGQAVMHVTTVKLRP